MSPLATAPGVAQKRSQIDSPRPSASTAPSIWNAAVAAPKPHRGREGGRVGLSAEIGDLWVDRRHPLTAPAVMPRTSQRCAAKKAMTTGIVETTPAAMSCP